jgi:hypothetical protein
VEVEPTEPENVTVIVDDPVVVTFPSHSSTSRPCPESDPEDSFVHVEPPPATDDTEIDDEFTFTERTRASPTVTGDTPRVVTPVPVADARDPTFEIDTEPPPPPPLVVALMSAPTVRDSPAGDWVPVGEVVAVTSGLKMYRFPLVGVRSYVYPLVVPAEAAWSWREYPTYNSPVVVEGVRDGKVMVVELVVLSEVPPVSLDHTVDAPVPAVYSRAESSVEVEPTEPENVTVIVDDPVVVTFPSHSSTSRPCPESDAEDSFVHVEPPPATGDTEIDDEFTFTERTRASPTVTGDTPRVVTPVPVADARDPTFEIDTEPPPPPPEGMLPVMVSALMVPVVFRP